MNDITIVVVWAIVSYLVGTIPVGDIVARAAETDIRARGTKNPGAANIYRELGPKYGVAVFFLDVAKGALATVPLLLIGLPPWARLIAAVAVLSGHLFPVFSKRLGGTGMATAMGAIVGLAPFGMIGGVPAALLTIVVTRNAGYAGAVLFGVTVLLAVWLRQDVAGALGVLGVGAIVAVKAKVQYGGWSTTG